jgi:hypothetical protein
MPVFHATSIRGKSVGSRQMNGGSFLLGNTLGGLQEADGTESALSGQGIGMGLSMMGGMNLPTMRTTGNGLSSINKKLESLMIKQSKPKPKNIKFSM